jgi:LemA protein
MFWAFVVVVLLILVAVGAVIAIYNGLVAARQRVNEAWSGIDVQLKRRSDLVPNLVETVKGYATHESDLIEQVTRTRALAGEARDASPGERAESEQSFGQAIGRLLAVAENYPALRASENFQELQKALKETENGIQHARRYFNGAVRVMNVKVQSFPGNMVADRFGFSEARFFELDAPAERELPKVGF